MDIRLLGQFEVFDGAEPVLIGPLKRRVVLATLALTPGRVVSKSRLIDAVWGEDPPAKAYATLQGLIYQLRQVLGFEMIEGSTVGYRLALPRTDVDATRLEDVLASGGDLATVVASRTGEALNGLGETLLIAAERERLEQLFVRGLESWADAELGAGRQERIIGAIEDALTTHAWRESLWSRLMIALYRSNRQADALAAFDTARTSLSEHLGLEPCRELRELEYRILTQDPSLDLETQVATGIAPGTVLPSGRISLLLTDVVGSTQLWERFPTSMDGALARQEELILDAVSRRNGTLLKRRGEGDSTFSVFSNASDALAAALDAQLAVIREPWPNDTVLSVRMAVHSGECVERDHDYFGPTVHRAARLRSIARAGEILVSRAAADGTALPSGANLVNLGRRTLKEMTAEEQVFALTHDELPPTSDSLETVPTQRTAVATLRDTAFCGRVGELEHLRLLLPKVTGSVAMIVGEPGIGKSRLVAELVADASADGMTVLWGRAQDGGWAPPYSPFVEALERALTKLQPDEARRLLGSVASPLAGLLPLVPELYPNRNWPRSAHSDDARFQIFDAVSRLLTLMAAQNPVVLVLDDLHWADPSTIALIAFLIKQTATASISIFGTYRDTEVGEDHPLAIALAASHRESRIERVRLRGLSNAATCELIASVSNTTPTEQSVVELRDNSGGNPFFLIELVRFRSMIGNGALPDSVSDTIRRRLLLLSPNANTLLRVGALCDDTFPLEASRLAADLEEDAVLDAIDEGIEAHLIEPAETPDEYRFVHSLARVAARSTVNPSRLPRMHRKLANIFEFQQSLSVNTELPPRIAHHYHCSRTLPGAERGVEPALIAAEHADTVAAQSERARMLRIAADLMSPADDRMAVTLRDLTRSLATSHQPDSATAVAFEAAALLANHQGPEAAARFLAELIGDFRMLYDYPEQYERLHDVGIQYAEHERSDTWAFLKVCRYGWKDMFGGEGAYRRRAQQYRDPEFRLLAPRALASGIAGLNRHGLYASFDNRAEALALTAVDNCPMPVFGFTGEYTRAIEHHKQQITTLERRNHLGMLAIAQCATARFHAALGNLAQARGTVIAAEATRHLSAQRSITLIHLEVFMAHVVIDSITDGPWEDHIKTAKALMADLAPTVTAAGIDHLAVDGPDPAVQSSVAKVDARRGRFDRAAQRMPLIVDYLNDGPTHDWYYSVVGHDAVEVMWWSKDTTWLEAVEGALRDRWLPRDFRFPGVDVRLSLARICALSGRQDEACEWFAQAREVFRDQRARPMSAIADFDEARMMLLGDATLPPAAENLLRGALAQFIALDMDGWRARATDLLATSFAKQP